MRTASKRRGGKPERFDFSTLFPQPPLSADGEFERERADEAARQAMYERQRNLERQPDLRLTDEMRTAIIRGRGLAVTKMLELVQRWQRAPLAKPTVIAHGNAGSGKSVGGGWLIAETGGVWLRAERARRAYVSNFGAELERLTDALAQPMLVLEDVGFEQDPVSGGALLCEVLEQRKDARHRTLITTNLTRAEWLKRYGDPRIVSRAGKQDVITESVHWVNVAGPDLRERAPATRAGKAAAR